MEGKPLWDTCERFVAYMDIMGFKARVLQESHEKVRSMLNDFYMFIKRFKNAVIFSDSIILISSDNSEHAAFEILNASEKILFYAIKNQIPIKGAIAYGETTADSEYSVYFGRSLIYAIELQKELQLYGGVLHHTMENRLAELDILKTLEDKLIFKYPVPMQSNKKSGNINHYMIDWMGRPADAEYFQRLVSKFYTGVSGATRLYVDNTMDFAKYLIEKKGI